MIGETLYHTFQRYRTLGTHRISALPIVILMPHSACNCRCVMCDIWKDNKNLKQLSEHDISGLTEALKRFGTKQVVMSGGEALLNPNFFKLCAILKKQQLQITLLSTGMTLEKHADKILQWVDEIIVSLDGNQPTHDAIRNIDGAFKKLNDGIQTIKLLKPDFRITSRTVIHRLNYRIWHEIIDSAREMGIDQVSFLPADLSSQAFNREILWSEARQTELALSKEELPHLKLVLDNLFIDHKEDFENHFIAESPAKLLNIYTHYAAFHQLASYPYKKCNAPWVSTVIEADGSVRPCFFHASIGNIKTDPLPMILNGRKAVQFRKNLDMDTNETCKKCVCYLNLPPYKNL